MPKAPSPTAEMQDAVSSAVTAFMKAANHALASAEEASKEELRRVLQDVREAQRECDELRRERDALVKEKATSAVELEAARGESERWRAAAEKAEWMINHQAETIAQLRLEAQQWKDQFMRVDDERLRLSARNDELVSQQLYANRRDAYNHEPLTPRSQGPQAHTSSTRTASSNQYVSSSVTANGYVTDGEVLNSRSARDPSYTEHPRARGGRTTSTRLRAHPIANSSRHVSQAQSISSQGKVLRTVHVVMQGGPVKEESLDSVALASAATGSESLGDEEEVEEEVQAPPPTQTRRRNPGKQKALPVPNQSTRRRWSEGRRVYDDESENGSASDEDADDDYVPSPKSRARLDEDDEDEDELMLGGEADRHGTYGTQKTIVTETRTPARRAQTQPVKKGNASSGPVRKRNSPYPTSGSGKKPRNR